MKRRLTVSLAVLTVAALGAVPSQAAPKKPKPITKSYKVTLIPDYTINQQDGCGVDPLAQDKRPITIPAKGTLTVKLDGGDHPGAGLADWDLYTLDANGGPLSASESDSVHENTIDKFKGKTTVSIWVCNLAGAPEGNISYTFTYA
jgi:hypothetical protein